MNDLPPLSERLRAWAKGLYPTMAAVDFMIDTASIRGVQDGDTERPWIDFERLANDLDEGALAYLSGGEISTLRLAVSLARGELDQYFWRLDSARQAAFIRALNTHR